jgi:hypothetical protein
MQGQEYLDANLFENAKWWIVITIIRTLWTFHPMKLIRYSLVWPKPLIVCSHFVFFPMKVTSGLPFHNGVGFVNLPVSIGGLSIYWPFVSKKPCNYVGRSVELPDLKFFHQ